MSLQSLVTASSRGTLSTYPRLAASATPAAEIRRLVERRLREDRPTHLRYLVKRLRSPEDAEDVLQEFALKVTLAAGRLTDPGKVDAWLGIALRNALFDRYRRNAARARLANALDAEPRYDEGNGTDDDVHRALHCLAQALAELPPETARLLRKAEMEDVPLAAIAGEMRLTANNVGVRLHRGRAALRRQMLAHCQACPEPCALAAAATARATRAGPLERQASTSIRSPCDAAYSRA
ncbi:MAG: RNA polymerase sigma factor [Alphaproteobacteria bacterium]|nr:RNA polymerase sigma factor [Alphaproteobacteria bacterium]MBU4134789.1 RNA polymerase sigma factor [Alphaproteobacteria bacterium]